MADGSLAGARVLVLATEQVGARMAGPAIRSWKLARQLAARGGAVTLALPREPDADAPDLSGLTVETFGTPSAARFRELAARCDVVLTQPQRVDVAWGLRRTGRPVIYDLYVPSFVERIAQLGAEAMPNALRRQLLERDRLEYAAALELGQAFICASERQRDHWLGALGHAGRLDVELLGRDPRGEQLVGVVPFGVPDEPPPALARGEGAIRGALVPDDSIVLLWTGGLWNWFDPVTVVEALAKARERQPRLRLVVMGMHHPDAQWQEQDASRAFKSRVAELGLLGGEHPGAVLCDSWAPYEQRHRYLLDADVAVSAHLDSLETRLSFRTRFLDHLWAGLPTITTTGGELADAMVAAGAARAVGERDVDGWTDALLTLADDAAQRERMGSAARQLAAAYRWSRVSEPLARIAAAQAARAATAPARPRRTDAARYAGLLVGVRVRTKGLRSLADAVRGAAGR